MKELFTVVTVEEALANLFKQWQLPTRKTEIISLANSLGRISAVDLTADICVPGFHRSTVDGFAVKAADTFGASEGMPSYLDIAGRIDMGSEAKEGTAGGQCWSIATGGMLPPDCDAVVMVEKTEPLADKTIAVNAPVAPGENVILKGEDFTKGERIVPAGRKLRPAELGVLAAAGVSTVKVYNKPRIAIISTGDELVDIEIKPAAGQIRDVNTYSLAALAEEAGAQVSFKKVIRDNYALLYSNLEEALERADIIIISGGSSVGTGDITDQLINSAGKPGVLTHGIALKPGKPTIIGLADKKPIFGLPGHPVSAMVTFRKLVLPCLDRLAGYSRRMEPTVEATLMHNLASTAGREEYIRVALTAGEEGNIAEPLLGKSGLISTMSEADGMICIPVHKEGLTAGEKVAVLLL